MHTTNEILAMLKSGLSVTQIADRVNLTVEEVCRLAKKKGNDPAWRPTDEQFQRWWDGELLRAFCEETTLSLNTLNEAFKAERLRRGLSHRPKRQRAFVPTMKMIEEFQAGKTIQRIADENGFGIAAVSRGLHRLASDSGITLRPTYGSRPMVEKQEEPQEPGPRWEVVDQYGNVVGWFPYLGLAEMWARQMNGVVSPCRGWAKWEAMGQDLDDVEDDGDE